MDETLLQAALPPVDKRRRPDTRRILGAALVLALAAPVAFAQSQQITRARDRAGMIGSREYFTGTANIEPIFSATNPLKAGAAMATFLPGARSAWHTQLEGQMLVVTAGTGWAKDREQEKQVIQPGDLVWCPPDVDHWHDATDKTSVSRIALQQAKDGVAVVWRAHVTDEEYEQ